MEQEISTLEMEFKTNSRPMEVEIPIKTKCTIKLIFPNNES